MEKYYDIAGMIVKVVSKEIDCTRNVLDTYEVEKQAWDRMIFIEMVDELSKPEGKEVLSQTDLSVYRLSLIHI